MTGIINDINNTSCIVSRNITTHSFNYIQRVLSKQNKNVGVFHFVVCVYIHGSSSCAEYSFMKQSMKLLTSNRTGEWYTPPDYIWSIKQVLGSIELDPASNKFADAFVEAERIYTEEDDGLSHKWTAETLFLNPPYCKIGNKSSQEVWMDYLISQLPTIGSCIALTKTVPGYKWYDALFRGKWPGSFCITTGRIRFVSHLGEIGGKAKAASTFWYYGPDKEQFEYVFYKLGRILRRDRYYIDNPNEF